MYFLYWGMYQNVRRQKKVSNSERVDPTPHGKDSCQREAHISSMWSINLNRENGGKRRIWVPKRKKERGEKYRKKE
jgi:hypothetical protein